MLFPQRMGSPAWDRWGCQAGRPHLGQKCVGLPLKERSVTTGRKGECSFPLKEYMSR